MSDFKNVLVEAKVSDLHTITENGGVKFLCFTLMDDSLWIINVSDGVDVWRLELDSDELEAHRDLSEVSSVDVYLARFRTGFTSGDLSVMKIGNRVTLTVGRGKNTYNFELYEAKAADKRTALRSVLFRLAELSSSLETKLTAANKTIETLKTQTTKIGGNHPFMDLGPKKGAVKNKPKKVGMSVINPTSKKRKAAKGVEFD